MTLSSSTPPALVWKKTPLTELLRLAWPTVISLVSLSFMTLVDTLFIGRLGAVALAAAGLGGVFSFAVLSFGLATLGAAKIKVGEDHGSGRRDEVIAALGALLRLGLILGVSSVAVAWAVAESIPWLSSDERTGALARDYTRLRSLGFPFVLVSAAVAQWLAAQGDSKSAMRAALAANTVNLPLNATLIFVLGWGIEGAALATAVSRVAETAWLVYQQKNTAVPLPGGGLTSPGFHWRKSNFAEAWQAYVRGFPVGLERVLDMVAFAAVPVLLSQMGPAHVAAHQIVLQLMLFSFLPLIALSESVSVLVSQAVGAKEPELIKRLSSIGLYISLGYASFCALACLTATGALVGAFSPDTQVVRIASATLVFGAVLQFINAAYNHFKGVLRGLSVFRFVAWVTVGCAWAITPPLTYLLGVYSGQGAPGAWKALCLEVSLGLIFLIWRLKKAELVSREGARTRVL